MKALFNSLKTLALWAIAWCLFLPAFAQTRQYRDPANPDRGSWQITTGPVTKNTLIRFFDGHQNQVYQEKMTGKYIKLTNRNVARINQTFDQVVGNSMVAAQVKANPLSSPAFRKLLDRQAKKKKQLKTQLANADAPAASTLQIHAY